MEVKIGIQNVAREVVIEATGSEADIEAAVRSALDGGPLVLTDDKGRRVMVPAGALGAVCVVLFAVSVPEAGLVAWLGIADRQRLLRDRGRVHLGLCRRDA